jgi:aminopeptidase N
MKYYSRIPFYVLIVSYLFIVSCNKIETSLIEEGVSSNLAKLREGQLSNIKYTISFQIPDSIHNQITGNEIIEFNFLKDLRKPLILDFRNPESFIKTVKLNEKTLKFRFENEHIIIPDAKLENGNNKIEIAFIAGDRALNRNKEYLYTLFVPDRASTVFPCFDQPSLKAKFQTNITVPNNWIAVANTPLIDSNAADDNRNIFRFDETDPISTYLFSFVAGQFEVITKTYDDRSITMYHRENEIKKVEDNINKIFDLQYNSIKWMKNYTQIDYPFKKFDFILIPSFQYSGMEHPGAVLYRDSKLLLESNATIREELDRANLIAHETAHMWFGDLVTMQWFSEVWLKEVFANFMAGKIVNPQFPQINHDLNFLINHYPASYNVDRTSGANPIEQELNNMKNAGTLYGSIIYHKAPIIMKHLESIIGDSLLQMGLQEYLIQNKYANASWDDLISLLDSKTDDDLKKWSHSWVYEPGMPSYNVKRAFNEKSNLESVIIEQSDPLQKGRQWSQCIEVLVSETGTYTTYQIELNDTFNVVELKKEIQNDSFIFPNSDGLGYGYFKLDSLSKERILQLLPEIEDPVLRCAAYISLWENMLHRKIAPEVLFISFLRSLETEKNAQNISLILTYIESIYWRFLTSNERNKTSENLECFLWKKIQLANSTGDKSSFFNTYKKVASTQNAVLKLYKFWNKEIMVSGINLSEKDYVDISFELAIRDIYNTDSILNVQYYRLNDTERKERFLFIRPAVSNEITIRDLFFESLKDEKNREKEPWVSDALRYFHHPLRSKKSVKYIYPSLQLLEKLQITGDIFFPQQWLDATFSGHSSIDAVMDINLFLNENPNLPDNLKNKILQSSDLVFRSSIIKRE